MKEVEIEKLKEIVTEPVPGGIPTNLFERSTGYSDSLFKFTRLLMEVEAYHVDDIIAIQKHSHDFSHIAGVHKFRQDTGKAGALRWFWSLMWKEERFLKQYPKVKQYIVDVCETSAYQGGWSKRPLGLFLGGLPNGRDNYPWRTAEWYAARRPKKLPYEKLTEFYPFISTTPNEDHELLLAVDALVPKELNNDMRADVCQDMVVAVLSGSVLLEDLKGERPKYMKQFFKMFPTKYGHLALDAPAYRSDNGGRIVTLGETIAAEYK